jgi:hypothetical protein
MRYTGEEKKSLNHRKKKNFACCCPKIYLGKSMCATAWNDRESASCFLFIYFASLSTKRSFDAENIQWGLLVLVIQQTTSTHTFEAVVSFTDVKTRLVFLLHLIIPGFLIYFVFGIHFYECLCCLILRHLFPTRQLYDVLPCIFSLKIFSIFLLPHALGMKKIIVICCVTFFHSSPLVIFCFHLMSSFRDEWPPIIKRTIKHRTY